MRSIPFHMRLMAACMMLSGIAFAKPVIQVAGDDDGFVLSDYSYKVAPNGAPEIELSLSQEDAVKMAKLTKKSLGGHVVVAIGGTEVMMPVVRDVVPGKDLKLSFSDHTTFAAVRDALGK